jgi:hypothetical protein
LTELLHLASLVIGIRAADNATIPFPAALSIP